jgi:hypothetical protein
MTDAAAVVIGEMGLKFDSLIMEGQENMPLLVTKYKRDSIVATPEYQ